MSTTHEAGWAHAPGAMRGPAWLRPPADPNALVPRLWSGTAHKRDGDLVAAYHRLLTSGDAATARAAARAWTGWEQATSYLLPRPDEESDGSSADDPQKKDTDRFDLAFASIENHYFVNHGFLRDGQLLDEIDTIASIPGVIVQGRYDVVCPMRSACDLHPAWPAADLRIVADAGHASYEPGIRHHLIEATDRFAR